MNWSSYTVYRWPLLVMFTLWISLVLSAHSDSWFNLRLLRTKLIYYYYLYLLFLFKLSSV